MRALGQLRDPAGVALLIAVMSHTDDWDDDWSMEEPPLALAMIGEPAIEPLGIFLADNSQRRWGRAAAVEALEQIAEKHPEHREACIAVLRERLRHFRDHDRHLNGSIISTLTELGVVEAADEMAQAFVADMVDLSIRGDWEDIQVELGLLEERSSPVPVGGWIAAEMERTKPGSSTALREIGEILERLSADNDPEMSPVREEGAGSDGATTHLPKAEADSNASASRLL